MGNREWGMGNRGMGNGEWGMGNGAICNPISKLRVSSLHIYPNNVTLDCSISIKIYIGT